MRRVLRGFFVGLFLAALSTTTPLLAQQAPEGFHWVDFHSPADQSVVVWVTRALQTEKWTAIREIGVEYDAALVVTTLRSSPDALPNAETFSVWSVSLTNHLVTALFTGVNLRWMGWFEFAPGSPREPGILYDDCSNCAATSYFTAFYYDMTQHAWSARWMHEGRAIAVSSASQPTGMSLTEVYAVLADPNGVEMVGVWNHFDYGAQKPSEDYVYQYDRDPWSGLDRVQQLNGKQAAAMEKRLCVAADAVTGLAHGQNSPLCNPSVKPRYERRSMSTSPANNQGRSTASGTRR